MNDERTLATQEPSVGQMLSGMLSGLQQGQITPQHVDVLKGMMDLYERAEKRQAEKDFAAALTDLQGETIRVQATKAVDVKDGKPRYTFAPYEEIMAVVQPMLTRHGFSVTFDTKIEEQRLYSICTLTHKSGHSRSNQFAVRFSKPPGSSDAQGDMSTKSYAKRGALCDALNISIDHDTDGDDERGLGQHITPEQVEELKRRVAETQSDVAKFLAYAEARSFEEISESKYDDLIATLERRAKAKPARKLDERDADGNFKF